MEVEATGIEVAGRDGGASSTAEARPTCTLCGEQLIVDSVTRAYPLCHPCYAHAYHADFAIARVPKWTPADEICDDIWLGGEGATLDPEWLAERRITRILTVAAHMDRMPRFPDRFEYLQIDIDDDPTESLLPHLPRAIAFLQPRAGSAVLVHCVSGISRSGAAVIAYYMQSRRVRVDAALRAVRARRGVVSPNSGFMRQLRQFEAGIMVTPLPPSPDQEGRQRAQRSCHHASRMVREIEDGIKDLIEAREGSSRCQVKSSR